MIDGSSSATARGVAIARAVGIDTIRDPLVASLLPQPDRLVVASLSRLPATRPAMGMTAHAALRMHAIDTALEEAVASIDPALVVVVGAGFDTRAWRLEFLRGRDVVEIDMPETQRAKRARLDQLAAPVARLRFVPVDLATADLASALDVIGQDPRRPVVWVWEAVVPYLRGPAVDDTLRVLAQRSPVGSRLLVTGFLPTMVTPSAGPLAFATRLGLAGAGEPVLTAESDAAMTARLASHGWRGDGGSGVEAWARAADVRLYGPRFDEHLHVATRGDDRA